MVDPAPPASPQAPWRLRSRQGFDLVAEVSGEGPPLLLVHGTAGDHSRWDGLVGEMARRFRVFALDRRGRGASGDAPAYHLADEVEDIAAVARELGSDLAVLAHSYGAVCTLEALAGGADVARAVLYEPPLYATPAPANWLAKARGMLAAGDAEGALRSFLAERVRTPPAELELLRSEPAWPSRVAAAPTIPREVEALGSHSFDYGRLAGIRAPVLVLRGSRTPWAGEITRRLVSGLPAGREAVLEGQGHAAMDTAPEAFLATVVPFLLGGD